MGILRAVGQHEADVREQPLVVIDRGPVAGIAQVLRHRDRHVHGHRVDVRHGRQHAELRAGAHVVAHVRRRMFDDAVDRGAQFGIADVHPGAAERLLGGAYRGFGGLPLRGVLVQLRLTDGIDLCQRHCTVVVVARFDGLRPGRFQLGFGRQHRGRKLVGVDGEQQLPPFDGHAVAVTLRRQVAVHARLDHGVEIARKVADETHPVGNGVHDGLGHLDPQGRHLLPGSMFSAAREERCKEAGCKVEFIHRRGCFTPGRGQKTYRHPRKTDFFNEKTLFFRVPGDGV